MGVELGNIIRLSFIPLAIIIAIGIISEVIILPFYSVKGGPECMRIPGVLIAFACLVWVGYKTMKEGGVRLMDGVAAGAFIGLLSSLAGAFLHVIFMVAFGIGLAPISTILNDSEALFFSLGIIMVPFCFGPIVWVMIGAVMGAIGAFIAGRK